MVCFKLNKANPIQPSWAEELLDMLLSEISGRAEVCNLQLIQPVRSCAPAVTQHPPTGWKRDAGALLSVVGFHVLRKIKPFFVHRDKTKQKKSWCLITGKADPYILVIVSIAPCHRDMAPLSQQRSLQHLLRLFCYKELKCHLATNLAALSSEKWDPLVMQTGKTQTHSSWECAGHQPLVY